MRVVIVLLLLALGSTAHADPADWVGGWSGKVTAKGCADDGTRSVTLDVALTSQGGLRSNGDLLQDGFGDLDWSADGANLAQTREGLKATFTAGKKGAKLALTTDGGCSIKGTLKRASSGIGDCDRLLALATIESECASMSSDTRGAKLDTAKASWSAWKKLRGKKKTAQGKQCKTDADAIAAESSGCASGASGIAGCDQVVQLMSQFQSCNMIPQSAKDAVQESLEQMKASWASVTPDQRASMEQACEAEADAIKQSLSAMGCPVTP